MEDNERLTTAMKYIKENLKISDLVKSFNRYGDEVDRGSYVMIPCPFHLDESPSFGIKDREGWCNCFSCGKGGNYVKLFQQLYEDVYATKLDFFRAVDLIIAGDPEISAKLGFSSVKSKEVIKVDTSFVSKRLSVKSSAPSAMTFSGLARKMKQLGLRSFADISFAQAMMFTTSRSPEGILSMLKPSEESDVENPQPSLSAADLLMGVEV